MLQSQLTQASPGFLAPTPTGRDKFLVNLGCRIPVGATFQQSGGVETGFVIPKKLRRPIAPRRGIEHLKESRQRAFRICFLLQADALLEQRLVMPMAALDRA